MSMSIFSHLKRAWRYELGTQIATVSVLTATFFIFSVSLLAHQNVQRMFTHWGRDVRVNVYLTGQAKAEDKQSVAAALEESRLFSSVEFLDKKRAAERFQKRVGSMLPGLIEDLDLDNPLPESFEMVIQSGLHTSGQFQKLVKLAERIRTFPGVEEMSYGQGWIENYAGVLKAFSITSGVFIFVLLAGGLFVIGNAIGTSIASRRDEIEILELFGATRGMIIKPYVAEGFVIGVVAGFAALLISYALYVWQIDMMAKYLSAWNIHTQVEFLTYGRAAAVVLTSALLGSMGSFFWVRKVNTGWAAAEANLK